jgi:hypothetical protein
MKKNYKIEMTTSGFRIAQPSQLPFEISWQEITHIVAYKKDLLTTDLVCFDIETGRADNLRTFTIHEEAEGFELLDAEFGRVLTGYNSMWRIKVIQPPFATNRTTIYESTPHPPIDQPVS